mmetsp:Transcript_124635/g.295769  ORF Transcript_124635/g.295769 Transcript_124635/m.295769 type:complete len:761 (+) Transcript_124635:2870-5152(+)
MCFIDQKGRQYKCAAAVDPSRHLPQLLEGFHGAVAPHIHAILVVALEGPRHAQMDANPIFRVQELGQVVGLVDLNALLDPHQCCMPLDRSNANLQLELCSLLLHGGGLCHRDAHGAHEVRGAMGQLEDVASVEMRLVHHPLQLWRHRPPENVARHMVGQGAQPKRGSPHAHRFVLRRLALLIFHVCIVSLHHVRLQLFFFLLVRPFKAWAGPAVQREGLALQHRHACGGCAGDQLLGDHTWQRIREAVLSPRIRIAQLNALRLTLNGTAGAYAAGAAGLPSEPALRPPMRACALWLQPGRPACFVLRLQLQPCSLGRPGLDELIVRIPLSVSEPHQEAMLQVEVHSSQVHCSDGSVGSMGVLDLLEGPAQVSRGPPGAFRHQDGQGRFQGLPGLRLQVGLQKRHQTGACRNSMPQCPQTLPWREGLAEDQVQRRGQVGQQQGRAQRTNSLVLAPQRRVMVRRKLECLRFHTVLDRLEHRHLQVPGPASWLRELRSCQRCDGADPVLRGPPPRCDEVLQQLRGGACVRHQGARKESQQCRAHGLSLQLALARVHPGAEHRGARPRPSGAQLRHARLRRALGRFWPLRDLLLTHVEDQPRSFLVNPKPVRHRSHICSTLDHQGVEVIMSHRQWAILQQQAAGELQSIGERVGGGDGAQTEARQAHLACAADQHRATGEAPMAQVAHAVPGPCAIGVLRSQGCHQPLEALEGCQQLLRRRHLEAHDSSGDEAAQVFGHGVVRFQRLHGALDVQHAEEIGDNTR